MLVRKYFACLPLAGLLLAGCGVSGPDSQGNPGAVAVRDWAAVKSSGILRWGGDEAGGAPYQFRDPENPSKLIGFEVDIAEELAKRLGLKAEFVQTNWPQLVPALQRGNFDIILSGLEVTPERRQEVAFSRPYYIFTQQIVVRKGTAGITNLDQLKGKKVGTLGATAAERLMTEAGGIEIKTYDDNVTPYKDLEIGRLDAVLLDLPLAVAHAKPNQNLEFSGDPFAEGQYAGAMHRDAAGLPEQVNDALKAMIADGTLKGILEKWGLWNGSQGGL